MSDTRLTWLAFNLCFSLRANSQKYISELRRRCLQKNSDCPGQQQINRSKIREKQKQKNCFQDDFDRLLIALGLPQERQSELEEEGGEEEIKIIGKIHELL